jgi:serine/threonine-protein kinase
VGAFIAKGGIGEVYRGQYLGQAPEHQQKRPLAIKILLPEFSAEPLYRGSLRLEAGALQALQDESIVRFVHFHDGNAGDRQFLVMEFLDGISLSKHLKEHDFLDVEEIRTLCRRLAPGLKEMCAKKITHRDISPDNIVVINGRLETAKLIDFGVVENKNSEHTQIHGFVGKYYYQSPEHLDSKWEPASDIYQLGLVLAELATGKRLPMGNTYAEIVDSRRRVPNLDHINPVLQPLLRRMLAPVPAERLTPEGLIAWCDSGRTPEAFTTPLPGAVPTTPALQHGEASPKGKAGFNGGKPWLRGGRTIGLVASAVAVLVSILAMVFWLQVQEHPITATPPISPAPPVPLLTPATPLPQPTPNEPVKATAEPPQLQGPAAPPSSIDSPPLLGPVPSKPVEPAPPPQPTPVLPKQVQPTPPPRPPPVRPRPQPAAPVRPEPYTAPAPQQQAPPAPTAAPAPAASSIPALPPAAVKPEPTGPKRSTNIF